jgi:hypothetical protein
VYVLTCLIPEDDLFFAEAPFDPVLFPEDLPVLLLLLFLFFPPDFAPPVFLPAELDVFLFADVFLPAIVFPFQI